MAQRVEHHPLDAAYAALLANGLDGAGEALRILVNEANKIERTHFLNAQPHERSAERIDYANGFKPKTVMTRVGELVFDVPQVRGGGFYPSALTQVCQFSPHFSRSSSANPHGCWRLVRKRNVVP